MPRRLSSASAVSLERVISVQSLGLGRGGERLDGLEHLMDRHVGGVVAQGRHGEGATTGAQQCGTDDRGDLPGIGTEGPGNAGSDQLFGCKNGLDQRLSSRWVGGSALQELAKRDGRTVRTGAPLRIRRLRKSRGEYSFGHPENSPNPP